MHSTCLKNNHFLFIQIPDCSIRLTSCKSVYFNKVFDRSIRIYINLINVDMTKLPIFLEDYNSVLL